ncbi:hypothetical protein D3C78_1244340 [compost metagenome]
MGPEVAERGATTTTVTQLNTEQQHARSGHYHRQDRQHLEQRQPELQLAEDPHAAEVQGRNEQHDAQHPDPARRIGKPQAHVDAERGHVGQAHHHHREGVGPTGEKAQVAPQVAARIVAEGTGHRRAHRHLPQGTHHQIDRRAPDQVRQQHRRARALDGRRRTVEEPRANGRPQCHEADMPCVQAAAHCRTFHCIPLYCFYRQALDSEGFRYRPLTKSRPR